LFEDTKRGVEGQVAYFREEIIPLHRRTFLGRFPLVPPWAKDLGIYLYEGVPVSSTHAATFALGFEPRQLFRSDSANLLRSVAEEYGRYVAILGVQPEAQAASFATQIDPAQLKDRDVRGERYYANTFNGSATPEINALLGVFRASLNFVCTLLPLDQVPASWQTIFKIRYLTVYHVLRSLEILRDDHKSKLTTASTTAIQRIVTTPDAQLLVDQASRPFRNTLMHYGLDDRIDLTTLDLTRPLYGLVQSCFQGHDHKSLAEVLEKQAEHAAETLNRWAGA
jgi:hypothetical protein